MFVYSLRASTLKFVGVLALSLATLITLITLIPTFEPAASSTLSQKQNEIVYSGIKSAEDGAAFLAQFGWDVKTDSVECEQIKMPAEFDSVMIEYNELQKSQGLDLSKYRRREVTRYTYKVKNYPKYDGTVYATILVYRNKVVGGAFFGVWRSLADRYLSCFFRHRQHRLIHCFDSVGRMDGQLVCYLFFRRKKPNADGGCR